MKTIESIIFIFCCLLLLSACKDSSTNPEDDGDIIEGVDFIKLFAEPDSVEINTILDEWKTRDISAQNYEVADTSSLLIGETRLMLRIISHTVGGIKHYGAIFVPAGAQPDSLPVVLYAHGGEQGVSIAELLLIVGGIGNNLDKFLYAVPSYRSEPLTFEEKVFSSGGEPSPWDRDVDDALALLNVVLETTPEANPERIGVAGVDRGATVGMLMAIRDSRIDLVVEFYGLTDFLDTFVQELTKEALRGSPRNFPGLNHLNDKFFQPLKNNALTIEDVRLELIRRSPVYFVNSMPQLQMHHGTADVTIPVSQAERLIEVLREAGHTEPKYEFHLYEGGVHNALTLIDSFNRTGIFIARLLIPALAEF